MLFLILFFSFLSYLYGAIPFSYIATYLTTGKNLGKEGTGNVGVTNAFKVGGKLAGITTVIGEISKALLPIYLGHYFFAGDLTITLLFVYCTLIGTNFSIFLKGKGGRGSTVALWSLLILSPYSLILLLMLWLPVIKLSRGNLTIKRIPPFFIPIVIFLVERDIYFSLFGLLTSFLFCLSSYVKKDDFVEYGILHGRLNNESQIPKSKQTSNDQNFK
jgi:glycerol-3-phosphate acyltransferase PlsY